MPEDAFRREKGPTRDRFTLRLRQSGTVSGKLSVTQDLVVLPQEIAMVSLVHTKYIHNDASPDREPTSCNTKQSEIKVTHVMRSVSFPSPTVRALNECFGTDCRNTLSS